ncbi:MarR family winged helix-turn-helix transcriptional regulator [Fodinicola feengrottensis]|uniref:HTH marR-type domain-containing protein n=1 Tax=Fodinicola feengrottensis TaxID=435914 RepID=A0ABP4ULY0_9ACTN|nr:MarR family transcriptional regulator [Fodinicola feengrottensis]
MESTHERLVRQLGPVMQEFQRALDVLDQRVADRLGLNRTDMHCLELALGGGTLTPGELATAAGLTTGGVTTAIDRLERAGYVTRVRDSGDRRRVLVQPTEKGADLAMGIYGPLVEDGNVYLRGLDDTTLTHLTEFMRFNTRLYYEHAQRLVSDPDSG